MSSGLVDRSETETGFSQPYQFEIGTEIQVQVHGLGFDGMDGGHGMGMGQEQVDYGVGVGVDGDVFGDVVESRRNRRLSKRAEVSQINS